MPINFLRVSARSDSSPKWRRSKGCIFGKSGVVET